MAAEPDREGARTSARLHLGLPAAAHVVAAFGGSLGAGRLNEAVLGLAARWSGREDVAIFHVVGTRNAEWAAAAAAELLGGLDPAQDRGRTVRAPQGSRTSRSPTRTTWSSSTPPPMLRSAVRAPTRWPS